MYTEEHRIFPRCCSGKYVKKEVVPHLDEWEQQGIVPREAWKQMGEQGFLCAWLEEEYGGPGAGFEYSVIVYEELIRAGAMGFMVALHSDIVVPYIHSFGSEEQKRKWLPGAATGDTLDGRGYDGAQHWVGPSGHPHQSGQGRRILGYQRAKDFYFPGHFLRPS